jgi:hypothetical protein
MNRVLDTIQVTNPCAQSQNQSGMTQFQPVRQIDKNQEIQRMGNWNLEEALVTYIPTLNSKKGLRLQDLQEMNQNLNQII